MGCESRRRTVPSVASQPGATCPDRYLIFVTRIMALGTVGRVALGMSGRARVSESRIFAKLRLLPGRHLDLA